MREKRVKRKGGKLCVQFITDLINYLKSNNKETYLARVAMTASLLAFSREQ